jgi:predicted acylesterase/phospholipase RssA
MSVSAASVAPLQSKTKLRIMLSGGGVRGIFQVGALAEILGSGRYVVDRVYGCSVGAIIAPFVASGTLDRAEAMLKDIHSILDIVERRRVPGGFAPLPDWGWVNALCAFFGMGLYRRITLVDRMKAAFSADEWEALKDRCFVVAYDVVRDQQTWFSGDELMPGIACSSALWLAVPPVEYAGGLFTDGGVVELFPVTHIDAAEDDDFDGEYLFVDCDTRVAEGIAAPTDGLSLMGALAWAAASRLAAAELDRVAGEMAAAGRVFHVIRPDVNRFTSAFDIDAAKITQAYEDGRLKGAKFVA